MEESGTLCTNENDAEGSDDPDFMRSDDGFSSSSSSEFDEDAEAEVGQEEAIEGDFDRLVQSIRLVDGATGVGVLSKDWDFSLEDKEAEFRDDLRAASGIGKKRRRGPRQTGPILSPQVRALIGEGNQAYVDCNISETIRIMQEVIRIEPRIASAWSVLAQCYEDSMEPQKALQLRIMAAHLKHDSDEWERLATQSKDLGYTQQALYCYRKLYSLDPENVDALWDRASLAKEAGELKTARHSLLTILKRFPHDLTVLFEIRPILIELSDFALCANLFQSAFEHYQALHPTGQSVSVDPNSADDVIPGGGFALMEILVLTDLYNTLNEYENAVKTIRQGMRWLQGRGEQKFWDVLDDDREYDVTSEDGRSIVERAGDIQPGFYLLDVNARHRLAVSRIKMGDMDEAKIHVAIVLAEEVLDYAPLFAEIADAYWEREMYAEALPIYEMLSENAETSSLYILLQVATCHRLLGDLGEAARVYEHIKDIDPTNNDAKMQLAEVYEILGEPRKALALVYEVIDSRKKPRKTREGEDAPQPESSQTASLFGEKSRGKTKKQDPHKLTHAQLRGLEEEKELEVVKGYQRLEELWPRLLGKADQPEDVVEKEQSREMVEREWLIEAEKLVETFRETRNLFLTTRHNPFRGMFPRNRFRKERNNVDEERMASRLHLDLEHDNMTRKSKTDNGKMIEVNIFRGVSFENWLRVFMQYAFLLTKNGQYDEADAVLRHILLSNAYRTSQQQDTIRLALITCAIAENRYTVIVEQCRKLILTHQFNNEPLRLLLASLASGLRITDSFISSTLQRHISREIRLNDAAVKNKDTLKWNTTNKRYAISTKKGEGDGEDGASDDEDDIIREDPPSEKPNIIPDIPKKDNPVFVAVYGQICMAVKSYQSAIFYLLHAHDYCPNDPMICLSLAIASIGRAMQRQSDNRHHLITQALAFLTRYRELRGSSVEGVDEVEFNFGRAFQQLGLHSHAVRHYERVLELNANKGRDDCGLAREAAYNLSLIFVMTGATRLAQDLYRRWLTL